jgi:positive regulator of sigma E activity
MPHDFLILVGTFVPVIGIALTVILGITLKHRWRSAALVLVPALTLLLSWRVADILGENGNLLFVTLLLLATVGAFVYYPTLIIIWLVVTFRKRHSER